MVFSYSPKPSFAVQNEAQISTPPQVDFGKK
jgi:LemA protein